MTDTQNDIRAIADEPNARMRVVHEITDDERADAHTKLANNLLAAQSHKEYLKEYKDRHVKPLADENEKLLAMLRSGVSDTVMTLQGIVSKDGWRMEYFDEDGVKHDERRLSKEEREELPFNPNRAYPKGEN